jgi:2-methylisocitrate lyase-like PEP mutase family enzyme
MLVARTEALLTPLGMEEALARCVAARRLGAEMTLIIGLKTLEHARQVAACDPGWKMWPDVGVTDGRPDVELADIDKLGFSLVTMHYTEKGAMFGMLDYGMRAIKDQNTVYIDEHDFDGLLPGKDHHVLLAHWKKWLPMEDELNDLSAVNAKTYDIRFE